MFAEIITVGDELLIGQVVDTNSAWLGRELNKIGIEIVQITSVRDRSDEIAKAVDVAMNRVDLVLMTGGLGPTKDDITKQTLCSYFNTELVFSEEVFENVKRVLAGRVPMNKLNQAQALVPKDCIVINNRVGTASVSWFERNGRILVSMPGVPQEMKTIMAEEILPRLKQKGIKDKILHRTYLVRNFSESVLAETLEEWEDALPACIKLAYLPKMGIVRLRLTARGENESLLNSTLDDECAKLKAILQDNLFADGDASVEEIIGRVLKEKGLTLATAESCTGGDIAARITSIAGSSAYFKGSVVAYCNEIKQQVLGVHAETLEKYGAVSEQTVLEMVSGVQQLLHTDCAISVSGIAGPGGGTSEKPVGTVWIAVAYNGKIKTMKQISDRGREMNTLRAGNNALLMLLELLK